jgi:hypothetical protein
VVFRTQLETFPFAHDLMLEPQWESVARRIVDWAQTLQPQVGVNRSVLMET